MISREHPSEETQGCRGLDGSLLATGAKDELTVDRKIITVSKVNCFAKGDHNCHADPRQSCNGEC